MLRRRALAALIASIAGIAAVLVTACGDSAGGGVPARPTTPAPVSTVAGIVAPPSGIVTASDILRKDPGVTKHAELKWGAMFELSGPLQGFGEPVADGLKLAVQEINDAGGFQVGDTVYTIKLLEHDTQSDTSQALAIATGLLRDDHVKVIWGPAAIGDAESTVLTQQSQTLHLCPCPDREVTALSSEAKVRAESRWAFQTLPAASRLLAPGAQDTRRDYPEFQSFATICVDSQVGRQFCKYFTDAYSAAGFEHVGQELFPAGTSDFRPFLTPLRSDDPDIILNFTDAGVAQFQLLRDSWMLDVGKFYIAVALPYDLFESLVGGSGIRSKIVAAGAAPRNHGVYTSDKARAFFEDKYRPYKGGSLPPAAFAALLTYDPAYMLIAAMQQAGTVDDTAKIADALTKVHYSGVGEDDMYFDARHLIITGTDACKLYQGQMTCNHVPARTGE